MNSPYGPRSLGHDLAGIARFNRNNDRARRVYLSEHGADERTLPCECGGLFGTTHGLSIHRAQHCPLRDDA